MKSRIIHLLIALLTVVIIPDSYAEKAGRKEIVVVMPMAAEDFLSPSVRASLTESFIGELIRSSKYDIVSGKIVSDAMTEAFKKQKEKKQQCDELACVREVAGNLGADLVLNILAGTTDPAFQKLNMTPNTTVRVTLKKPEHHDLTFEAELRPGISKYERLELKPAFGYLTVEGEPLDAEVYIGGSLIGNTPVKT